MNTEWSRYFCRERESVFTNLKEAEQSAKAGTGSIYFREEADYYVAAGRGIHLMLAAYSQMEYPLCSADIFCLEDECAPGNRKHFVTTIFDQETDFFCHRHEFYEIMYVIRGEVKERIYGQTICLKQGEILILNTNVKHEELFAEEAMVVYLGISRQAIKQILEQSALTECTRMFFDDSEKSGNKIEYLCCAPNDVEELETLIAQIFEERSLCRPGSRFMIYGLTSRLISIVDRERSPHKQIVSKEVSNTFSLFLRLERFLEKQRWNIETGGLGREFHYSETYLNKIMKIYTGKSLSKYCVDHKLSMAEQLLKKTDMSIHDIISYLGYENKSYFYRIFKQKFGDTPQKYREK